MIDDRSAESDFGMSVNAVKLEASVLQYCGNMIVIDSCIASYIVLICERLPG